MRGRFNLWWKIWWWREPKSISWNIKTIAPYLWFQQKITLAISNFFSSTVYINQCQSDDRFWQSWRQQLIATQSPDVDWEDSVIAMSCILLTFCYIVIALRCSVLQFALCFVLQWAVFTSVSHCDYLQFWTKLSLSAINTQVSHCIQLKGQTDTDILVFLSDILLWEKTSYPPTIAMHWMHCNAMHSVWGIPLENIFIFKAQVEKGVIVTLALPDLFWTNLSSPDEQHASKFSIVKDVCTLNSSKS